MAVEAEAAPIARARECRQNIGTVRIQSHLPRIEAFPDKPVLHVVGDRTFFAGWTVNIGEVECHLYQFVDIDLIHDFFRIHAYDRSPRSTSKCRA